MGTPDFIETVLSALQPLTGTGQLTIESAITDPASFGNSMLVFQGKSFRVRIIRDRGEVLVDVACAQSPDQWDDLQRALTAMDVQARPGGPLRVEEAVELLNNSIGLLDKHLCEERVMDRIAELRANVATGLLDRFDARRSTE